MPAYNLANVMGMSPDTLNSMFSNPQFQTQFSSMFANNPNMQSGIGNLYANNPTFRAGFGALANQNWGGSQQPGSMPGAAPAAGAPYASMYQPPSMLNLSANPNTGLYGMQSSAPQAPMPATSQYDPRSFAQFSAPQQTVAGLAAAQAAAQPKQKSPTFFEQIAPYVGAAASIASHFI